MQCAALGPALSLKERRRRLVCFAKIPKSCRNLLFSPLPRPPFHSTPVANERDLFSSNLPSYMSHHLLSLLALPSSTHAVIQWKISAVNLSVYGFAIVATPRTLVSLLSGRQTCGSCTAGWITDFSFLFFFFFSTYVQKVLELPSLSFRHSARPEKI